MSLVELHDQQSKHEHIVEQINDWIKKKNNSTQDNHFRWCRNVSRHNSIVKASKNRKRKSEYKTL